MQHIVSNKSDIFFGDFGYSQLNTHLANTSYSIIFVLVDENTHEHCLPYFLSQLATEVTIEIIEIEAGEIHKHIETCSGVWSALSELGADRKSLMINLGGGVITDLGGFVASTFKRGIEFINVPTSLLSMVDASVGGKTGVDLGNLKNQVGLFNEGVMVLVDTNFLTTLPTEELYSGYAEMLKHALITSEDDWLEVKSIKEKGIDQLDALIYRSVTIKNEVVLKDPTEQGLRKTLNYGHTLGHAVESYFLSHPDKKTLLHGEAIGIGIILASFISSKLFSFPAEKLAEIKEVFLTLYKPVSISENDVNELCKLLIFDKKNAFGKINFILLADIGKHKIDIEVDDKLIKDSFNFYRI